MTAPALAVRNPDAEQAASAAANWLRIGQEHYSASRNDNAIAAYQCGLAAAAAEPAGQVSVATISELHSHLGNAWMVRGDLEQAAVSYKAALRLAPELTSCWCNLGNVHVKTGKPREAVAFYLQALKTNPAHWASRTNLVQALIATRQYVIARAMLLELIGERPQDGAIRHQLGKVHYELNEAESAVECFEQAIALNPRDADSLYWLGGIRQQRGEIEASAGRLCAGRGNPAFDPAAGDQIAGGFSRARAVRPVRRQHTDRISVQECGLRYRHPRVVRSRAATTLKSSDRAFRWSST